MIALRRYRLAFINVLFSTAAFVSAGVCVPFAGKLMLLAVGTVLIGIATLTFIDKTASPTKGELITLIAYYEDEAIIRLSNDKLAFVSQRNIDRDAKVGDSLWCMSRHKFMLAIVRG